MRSDSLVGSLLPQYGGHGKKLSECQGMPRLPRPHQQGTQNLMQTLYFLSFCIQLTLFRMAEATTVTTATRQSRHDVGTRLQALCLFENKVPVPQIKEITGIATSQIYVIRKTAITRGYDPAVSKKLLLSYVEDAPRSRRPPKVTEDIKKQVVEVVTKNSTTRQMTT